MNPNDLRLTADHFRALAGDERDAAVQAELHMLAVEYENAAANIESGAGTAWSASVMLPNC